MGFVGGKAGRWLLFAVPAMTQCHAQPLRPQLPWLADVEVANLGSGNCVVTERGNVRCEWSGMEPSQPLGEPVKSLAAASSAAHCALLASGRVTCWGCVANASPRPPRVGPRVLPLDSVVQIAVGESGACALHRSGTVSCWGEGFWNTYVPDSYDYGICHASAVTSVTERQRFPRVRRIAMANDGRLCGVTEIGETFCIGSWQSQHDQITGVPPVRGLHKIAVPRARDIAAGEHHFCTLGVDGTVSCWGENGYAQCGGPNDHCVTHFYTGCTVPPQRVRMSERATAVAAGARHSCAILESGRVACWGDNDRGALGFRSEERCHPYYRGFCDVVPGVVSEVNDIAELTVSRTALRTWARTERGSVISWPDLADRRIESRPLGAVCEDTRSALSAEQVKRREFDLIGKRIQVRGRLSTMLVQEMNRAAIEGLLLHPLVFGIRPNEDVIVDGQVTRFYVDRDAPKPLGIRVFDICRIGVPERF